jgi:hypothetical protein
MRGERLTCVIRLSSRRSIRGRTFGRARARESRPRWHQSRRSRVLVGLLPALAVAATAVLSATAYGRSSGAPAPPTASVADDAARYEFSLSERVVGLSRRTSSPFREVAFFPAASVPCGDLATTPALQICPDYSMTQTRGGVVIARSRPPSRYSGFEALMRTHGVRVDDVLHGYEAGSEIASFAFPSRPTAVLSCRLNHNVRRSIAGVAYISGNLGGWSLQSVTHPDYVRIAANDRYKAKFTLRRDRIGRDRSYLLPELEMRKTAATFAGSPLTLLLIFDFSC